MKRFLFSLILGIMACAPAHAGTVVATIKPLHSLVANVMEGDGNTLALLVDGKTSPHTFTLKPSQVRALSQADIVFYIGDGYELFLGKVLQTMPDSVRRAPMDKIEGLTLYPVRQAEGEAAGNIDLHLWMSPANAQRMAVEIARRLSDIYPAQRALYENNAIRVSARIDALDAHLNARMQRLQGKPFIIFHDATQYFEKAYGLEVLGAVTLHPEQSPSARHLQDIRENIRSSGATCLFSEPSFDAGIIDNVLAGTSAKSGELDPEAARLQAGRELYFQLMESLAADLEACLI